MFSRAELLGVVPDYFLKGCNTIFFFFYFIGSGVTLI